MKTLGLLGPENTFHDLARKKFLPQYSPSYFPSFNDIFKALKEGQIEQALVGLRNSGSGLVANNLEVIKEHFKMTEQFELPITLCLGSPYSNSINSIRKVFSHPMAIKETVEYFAKYDHIRFIKSKSTAGALEELKKSNASKAAVISSKEALLSQKFEIIAEGIQDDVHNTTTFGLIRC